MLHYINNVSNMLTCIGYDERNVNSNSNDPRLYTICDLESQGYVIDLFTGYWTAETFVQAFPASFRF